MKYLALYRKYRPKTFDEVCGQQVTIQTLKNVIKNNKLTHSYLFIGPRGTGKTSIAKIFAKTINCENQIDGCSCEKCNSCISNNTTESIDIIEMDAASNNGVDEIREIKNHVTLLPTNSKYKIYIIDEVHMLTTGAFNALLKTLEEPPQHVIFILATTEPHKIPLTIKSRCQSFEFKPIPKQIMIERLKYICDEEKIKISDNALELIVQNSNGGMRDAISLLDQINAYSDGNIKDEDVILLNGRISEDQIKELFEYILKNDYKQIFTFIDEIENTGKEFTYICEDIIKFLRNKLLEQQINNLEDEKMTKNQIIDTIVILNDCINEIKNTKDKRIYFDLSMIKIFDIFNQKQTNVRKIIEKENESVEQIDTEKQEEVTNKQEEKEKVEIKKEKSNNNLLYEELMKIRLNNILSVATKKSLTQYENSLNELSKNVTDLNDLKVINILNDCSLKAASESGVVITVDNVNILEEIYENLELIEKTLNDNLNNKVSVCSLLINDWNEQREIYVQKIKNKEKIEQLDETEIIEKIKTSKQKNKNEFEDLIEIGE